MANPRKRVPENVPGDFFVDSTCIDCDACRQIAPAVFAEAASTSFVKAQPVASADRRRALQALLACPTGSIGCLRVAVLDGVQDLGHVTHRHSRKARKSGAASSSRPGGATESATSAGV